MVSDFLPPPCGGCKPLLGAAHLDMCSCHMSLISVHVVLCMCMALYTRTHNMLHKYVVHVPHNACYAYFVFKGNDNHGTLYTRVVWSGVRWGEGVELLMSSGSTYSYLTHTFLW